METAECTIITTAVGEGGAKQVITVTGELDLSVHKEFEAAITEAMTGAHEGERLVIDLRRVLFIDSAGLAGLVLALRRSQEVRMTVTIAALPTGQPARILKYMHLAKLLGTVFLSEEADLP